MTEGQEGAIKIKYADMAELADAIDIGSSGNTRAGSSPVIRTFYYLGGAHINDRHKILKRKPGCGSGEY